MSEARAPVPEGLRDEAPAPTPLPMRADVRSFALTGLFLLALLYTLYAARAFLVPLIVALLLSLLFTPTVRRLRRAHVPEGVSAALILLGLVGAFAIGIYSLSGPAA
ncbi:MAG TPA: AI-2E family transporter, partial [Vicinamibacteria bacterium]